MLERERERESERKKKKYIHRKRERDKERKRDLGREKEKKNYINCLSKYTNNIINNANITTGLAKPSFYINLWLIACRGNAD